MTVSHAHDDFASAGLAHKQRFRCLNVVDDYARECLVIEVDTSLPGIRVNSFCSAWARYVDCRLRSPLITARSLQARHWLLGPMMSA